MRRLSTAHGLVTAALLAAVPALIATPGWAADPPALPAELDALKLADEAVPAAAPPARDWRLFVEGALGRQTFAGQPSAADLRRASIDFRLDTSLAPGLRAVLSNRLDLVDRDGEPPARNVNTLREAYLGWAATPSTSLDLGRINERHGAAIGYNPTDWFREGALRSVVSPDPAQLRENRQGSVLLRGQQVGAWGALTVALSPELGNVPDPDTVAFDAATTNPRDRWLVVVSPKLPGGLNPQLLLHGGAQTPVQWGLNLSALAGDAVVLFGEFSSGRGRSLAAQAAGPGGGDTTQRRAAAGLTYTTPFNLSLTLEAEHNGAAPNADEWHALDPATRGQLLALADRLQDLPMRRAWFLHALWKDAGLPGLDFGAYLRHDAETRSRDQWLEARYRAGAFELALQWQRLSGDAGTIYGLVPQRRALELSARYFF